MPRLQIIASRAYAGKTTFAAALASGLARAGERVRLLRAGVGAAAEEDAATFAEFAFASSPGRPVAADDVPSPPDETVVVETEAGETLADAPALLVVRGGVEEADRALAAALGKALIGSIATAVAPGAFEAVGRQLTDGGLRPLAVIPEDRILAAPCVVEIRDALGAGVLYEAENGREVVEDVLIAPVYADPAQPHFRRFASKAILAPYNKTDLHLAAIEAEAACLVITGGHEPSPYVIDRAQHGATTVLLSAQETPESLASLAAVWEKSRFRGERKLAAVMAHLQGRIDFAGLRRKLS